MAVPKKKTSKAKRDQRRAHWKRKATIEAQKALSLGKSVLTGRSSFVYPSPKTTKSKFSIFLAPVPSKSLIKNKYSSDTARWKVFRLFL